MAAFERDRNAGKGWGLAPYLFFMRISFFYFFTSNKDKLGKCRHMGGEGVRRTGYMNELFRKSAEYFGLRRVASAKK